jgi:hypothetical protein
MRLLIALLSVTAMLAAGCSGAATSSYKASSGSEIKRPPGGHRGD